MLSAIPRDKPRLLIANLEAQILAAKRTPDELATLITQIEALARDRLADAESKLEAHLSPREKWERGERTPENEARVRPFLDKVFAVKAGADKRPYEVECHAAVCKLTVRDDEDRNDWMHQVQTSPEGMGMFRGWMFGPDGAYGQLDNPKAAAGKQLLATIAMAVHGAPTIATCKRENSASGTMTVTISLDASGHRLKVMVNGPLADQAVGVCIRRAVEDIISAIAVPADVTSLPDLPIPFEAL